MWAVFVCITLWVCVCVCVCIEYYSFGISSQLSSAYEVIQKEKKY